ncbi:MAG: PrgI family protein [Candidatus Pacebacteria bacterium]|nr:PrgI family protein [Candidatus Paceibacterota bacterium]
MQFQVPQFIDVSPKIVGPLTLKQFLYVASATVISIILFYILQFWLWIFITVFLGLVAIVLSFGKFNGVPATKIILAAFNYLWHPRSFLWKKEGKIVQKPTQSSNPLKDLFLKISTSSNPIGTREKSSKIFQGRESEEDLRKTTGEIRRAHRIDYR